MANYETPEEVAKFLEGFTLTVNREMKGTFTPDHTRYLITLEKPHCKPYNTAYESNPAVHGAPTVTQVFSALALDAQTAYGQTVAHFLDEFCAGGMKPSQALAAYEGCKATYEWMRDELNLTGYELEQLSSTLDEQEGEVSSLVEKAVAERAVRDAHDHPKPPKGFVTIEQLKADLDIGEVASDHMDDFEGDLTDTFMDAADAAVDIMYSSLIKWLPGNEGWLEDAEASGLLEGTKGDIYKMIQMAQYECFRSDLYEHREDICRYGTLDQLESAGIYAISQSLADDIMNDLDYSGDYTVTDEAKEAIASAVSAEFEERYGEEFAERAGELLDDDPVSVVNPCAMGIETVRAVNEKGYDAVFAECWKEEIAKDGSSPADWGIDLDGTSLNTASKEVLSAKDALAGGEKAPDAPSIDAPDAPKNGDGNR